MRRDEIIQMGDGIGEERRFNVVALTQQKATSVPYLTWLYLADKQHGFSFLTFSEGRPANNCSTDDGDVLNSLCLLKYDGVATDFLACPYGGPFADRIGSGQMGWSLTPFEETGSGPQIDWRHHAAHCPFGCGSGTISSDSPFDCFSWNYAKSYSDDGARHPYYLGHPMNPFI